MISIEKCSQLDPQQIAMAKQLLELCDEYDHCETKFYWSVTEDRVNDDITDFIFKVENHIIGYLALYYFGPDEVEICAIVHPEFRNQGIFKRLWDEAQMELKNQGIERCLFLTNSLAVTSHDALKAIGANFQSKEYRFEATEPLEIKVNRKIDVRSASRADIPVLTEIDSLATGSEPEDIQLRISHIIDDNDRKIYIGEYDGKPIVKLHLLFEEDMAFLHDFCVVPEYQGKGHASFFLRTIINKLLNEQDIERVELDAGADELAKFYRKNALTEVASFQYWVYYLGVPHPNYMTLH